MDLLRKVRGWLGVIAKGFGWILPPHLRAILQAVQIGLDAFILAYKTARKMQAEKMKREIDETVEKMKDPRLSFEERLKLNAKMESNFKHFVSDDTDK